MAAVRDHHGLSDNFQFYYYTKKTHYSYIEFPNYFNAGILFVKNNALTRSFYKDWYNLWLKESQRYNYDFDQPSFNIINLKYDVIQKLDDKFNCQLMTTNLEKK